MKIFSLAAYTFSHFAVDFSCFWILFGNFSSFASSSEEIALGFIIYNFIAFGLQMIIGAYCDDNRKFPSASIGCALVFTAVLISAVFPWAAVIITALGNAFFHVGGGIDCLVNSGGKLYRGGVFVSAGAIGVVLGTLVGGKTGFSDFNPINLIEPALFVFIGTVFCYIAHKKCGMEGEATIKGSANSKAAAIAVITLALVSVIIRAFGGTLIPMEWKTGPQIGLYAGYAAFFGKFIGGFAADIFGARRTGVISLLLSLPLLILGNNSPIISLGGIVLFNITMPITLGIVAEKMPKNPGIAFGLTTAALLLGSVPSFFVSLGGNIALLIPAVLISAAAIFFAAENKKSSLEVL